MIAVARHDVARPPADDRIPADDTWVLVTDDGRVLGDVWIDDAERRRAALGPVPVTSLDELVRRHVAEALAAREAERDDAPAHGLPDPASVTVAVCTRDRSELLAGCLASMARLDPAPGEVLVVDNAPSDDSTRDVALAAGVRHVVEPRPGLNRARERARHEARGEVVAFVDDDARPEPGFVAGVVRGFLDPSVGAVTGLVVAHELATPAQVAFERSGGMRKGVVTQVFTPGSVGPQAFRLGVGTAMAFRREALDAIGGFDPRIGVGTPSRGGGDLEALWRVLESGRDVVYEPDAVVAHIHRRTHAALVAQHRDNGVAYASFLRRLELDGRARAARVELLRWHLRRHLVGPIAALAHGRRLEARLLVAEARGSLSAERGIGPRPAPGGGATAAAGGPGAGPA